MSAKRPDVVMMVAAGDQPGEAVAGCTGYQVGKIPELLPHLVEAARQGFRFLVPCTRADAPVICTLLDLIRPDRIQVKTMAEPGVPGIARWLALFSAHPCETLQTLSEDDAAVYRLWAERDAAHSALLPRARNHPAWPFAAYTCADKELAARLLAHTGDWRWYRHPERPGRWTRLHSHLGLRPQTIRRVLAGTDGDSPSSLRCGLTLAAWGATTGLSGGGRQCLCLARATGATAWRELLRASKKWVSTLAAFWLASCENHSEVVFRPEDVFTEEGAIAFVRALGKGSVS